MTLGVLKPLTQRVYSAIERELCQGYQVIRQVDVTQTS